MNYDVVHVTQPTEAGVGRYVAGLAAHQRNAGYEVAVICPPLGELPERLASADVPVFPWDAVRALGPATLQAELRGLSYRFANVLSPTAVVHLHSSKAGLVGRLLLRGSHRTVFQPHGFSFLAANGALERAVFVAWERVAQTWASTIVAVSEGEANYGRRAGIRSMLTVPNGVPLRELRAAAEVREELGLPAAPTVVCLGRVSRQKGQDVLLRAWPRVLECAPTARLYLVGSGSEDLASIAHDLPSVVVRPYSRHPETWLEAADIVVVPSRWEGMPLVLLEAMAAERSVVASDIPGIREVIGSRNVGALVAAENPRELGEALCARLSALDLARQEGAAGRALIASTYSSLSAFGLVTEITLSSQPRSPL